MTCPVLGFVKYSTPRESVNTLDGVADCIGSVLSCILGSRDRDAAKAINIPISGVDPIIIRLIFYLPFTDHHSSTMPPTIIAIMPVTRP